MWVLYPGALLSRGLEVQTDNFKDSNCFMHVGREHAFAANK